MRAASPGDCEVHSTQAYRPDGGHVLTFPTTTTDHRAQARATHARATQAIMMY